MSCNRKNELWLLLWSSSWRGTSIKWHIVMPRVSTKYRKFLEELYLIYQLELNQIIRKRKWKIDIKEIVQLFFRAEKFVKEIAEVKVIFSMGICLLQYFISLHLPYLYMLLKIVCVSLNKCCKKNVFFPKNKVLPYSVHVLCSQ